MIDETYKFNRNVDITTPNNLIDILLFTIIPDIRQTPHLYRKCLSCICANMKISYDNYRWISISRNRNDFNYNYEERWYTYTIFNTIIDKLLEYNFIDIVKGYYDRSNLKKSFRSRISPTEKLINLFQNFKNCVVKPEDTTNYIHLHKSNKPINRYNKQVVGAQNFLKEYNSFIIDQDIEFDLDFEKIRGEYKSKKLKKGLIEFAEDKLKDLKYNISISKVIPIITNYITNNNSSYTSINNNTYKTYTWLLRLTHHNLLEYLRKVGKVSLKITDPKLHRIFTKNLQNGGRFYLSPHINLPKIFRETITINGEETTELDYSGLHISLLYHRDKIDYKDEFYVVSKEENPELRELYKKMCLNIINAKTIKDTKGAFYESCCKDGLDIKEIVGRDKPVDYIYDTLCEYHKPISKYFSSGEGIKLQYLDSCIMEGILMECMKLNIPALPVHDSVICPASKKDIVYDIMKEEYKKRLGFYPVIK